MAVPSTETVGGRPFDDSLGTARGNPLNARPVWRDIGHGFQNLTGRELGGYSELVTHARDESLDLMRLVDSLMNADGAVNGHTASELPQRYNETSVWHRRRPPLAVSDGPRPLPRLVSDSTSVLPRREVRA